MTRWDRERQRALRDPEGFWADAAEAIEWERRWDRVLDRDASPHERWFVGARLNTCFNAVDRHVRDDCGDQAALIYDSAMTARSRTLTYRQLLQEVSQAAGALRSCGVGPGDRVIVYMPAIPEAVVAMLACARLGAVHSVVFGGFAARELATRIAHAQPTAVVSASCGLEPGRVVEYKPMLDEAIELAGHAPNRCLIVQPEEHRAALLPGRDLDWAEAVAASAPADCVAMAATDPLYTLYTSGTTGQPKAVVRDNGGHAVALRYSMDAVYGVRPGQTFWAASDLGWQVGHSYITYGPLLHGCTTVLECAVFGVADELKGEIPIGFVVVDPNTPKTENDISGELTALVRDTIGPVAALRQVAVVPRLPKTRSGKTLRRTIKSIADGVEWRVPPTIEDPAALTDVEAALHRLGYPRKRRRGRQPRLPLAKGFPMPDLNPRTALATHQVVNQVQPTGDINVFASDLPLREALHREGAGWAADRADRAGAVAGAERTAELARLANVYVPQLKAFNRYGQRIDEVEFHPAWHELMRLATEHEVGTLAWRASEPGGNAAHVALSILFYQAEAGIMCPMSLNNSAPAVLRLVSELAEQWEPAVLSTDYDPRCLPVDRKRGAIVGLTSTEKQGGSDLRQNSTRAEPLGARRSGQPYRLYGHKWFCSVPMADAWVVLAQTEPGPTCLLMPRWAPDNGRNSMNIQRLKDKLGNRSNASAEIELDGAFAWMIGSEGHGVSVLMKYLHRSRLDMATAPVGLMRQALTSAVHHATHRVAFGAQLAKQPLMLNVLADLALESEAATALIMRIGRAFDEETRTEQARAFARIGVAVAKYWLNKRAGYFVHEALECHGGNGYIEEAPLARIYREVPLNGIWEGSGNVMCLDVLRAMRREPLSIDAVLAELQPAANLDDRFDRAVADLKRLTEEVRYDEGVARTLVERMALTLQAALLLRHAPGPVAETFIATRLGVAGGRAFGTLPTSTDLAALVDRNLPIDTPAR